jgi:mucin-2
MLLNRKLPAMIVALGAGVVVAIAIAATGTAYAAGPTYNLQGGWILGSLNAGGTGVTQDGSSDTYTITSMDMSSGDFSGTAVIESIAFAVTGTETGSVATYTLSEGGYTAYNTMNLTVFGDGNVGGSGSFTDSGGSSGNFNAELTTPAGGTTTTGTTSTTTPTSTTPGTTTTGTTTTSTSKIPTSTAVQCDYFVASQNDTCTAAVGNADGSIVSTPTGAVKFTGDETGSCSLQPTSGSPGIASCPITVPNTASSFLNITASYSGDSTHSASSGNTAFLTAAPGNGLYNQTIQAFQPNTINAAVNNPDAGSTVTGLAQLSTDPSADCGSPSTAQTSRATLGRSLSMAGKSKTRSLTVTVTVRRARKGKVVLHLKFSSKKVKAAFKTAKTLALLIRSTVKPPKGKGTTRVATTVEVVTVHYSRQGLTFAKYKPSASKTAEGRSAHDETSSVCYQAVDNTYMYKFTSSTGGVDLTFKLTIPAGSVSPSLNPDAVGTLTGTVTETCGAITGVQWPVYEVFYGAAINNKSQDGANYTVGVGQISLYGPIPAPPSASPNLPPCGGITATGLTLKQSTS